MLNEGDQNKPLTSLAERIMATGKNGEIKVSQNCVCKKNCLEKIVVNKKKLCGKKLLLIKKNCVEKIVVKNYKYKFQ